MSFPGPSVYHAQTAGEATAFLTTRNQPAIGPPSSLSIRPHHIFIAPHPSHFSTSPSHHPLLYSIVTTAPNSFIVATIFSASSFGTDSFICFGALSTNFLESTRLSPNRFLISLMTLGLEVASNDCSFSVKSVFSAAAGAASSSSAAAAAGAAPAAGAAAKPPTGRSGMLRRVWGGVCVSMLCEI